jgi:hypothetical protein
VRFFRQAATVMPLFLCSAINRVAASVIPPYKKEMPPRGDI